MRSGGSLSPPREGPVRPVTYHVDILKNDWAAGVQRRVAIFAVNGGGVVVEGPQREEWAGKLLHPLPDPVSGYPLDPASAPKEWLEALARRIQGSYLIAVGPHEAESCDVEDETPMRAVALPAEPPGVAL
jgi:hypothetical protein